MNKFKPYLFLMLFFTWANLPAISYAAGGIGALPTHYELKGSSGEKLKGSYSVYNSGEKPVEVEVYFRDYFKLEENMDIDTKDWLYVRPKKFRLNPQEKREVKYIARVPEGAVGEVMSMIFFRAPSGPDSNVMMSFGVSLYVMIEETEVIKGEIGDIKLNKVFPSAGDLLPYYSVEIPVKNNGNVHLRPHIKIDLYRDKKKLKTSDVPFGWPVFPNETYRYLGSWKEEDIQLDYGSYMVEAEVRFYDQILKKKSAFFVDKQGNVCTKKGKR